MATRDFAFEALAEVTNTDWEVGRGELNASLKSIKLQEPDIHDGYLLSCEIHDRAKMYAVVFGDEITLTPTALAKHWKRVKAEMPKPRPTISPVVPSRGEGTHGPSVCEACDGDKMVVVSVRIAPHSDSGFEEMAPCPECNSHANADFWRGDGSRFTSPDAAMTRMRMRQQVTCRRHEVAGEEPHWCMDCFPETYASGLMAMAADLRRRNKTKTPTWKRELQAAYDLGFRTDEYATGKFSEYFTWKEGDAHRDMMGMSLAAEKLVALTTGRRWLNENQTGTLDQGADVEGLSVRWRDRPDAELIVHRGKRPLLLPIVFVTGPLISDLVIRGWIYPNEICQDIHWNTRLPYPAWSMSQFNLHDLSTLPPL